MIARIIMSEHPDEEGLKLFASDHKDAVKDGFLANTHFSISVQTSPTSLLVISDMKIKIQQTRTFWHVKNGLRKGRVNT